MLYTQLCLYPENSGAQKWPHICVQQNEVPSASSFFLKKKRWENLSIGKWLYPDTRDFFKKVKIQHFLKEEGEHSSDSSALWFNPMNIY